jgi:hypothetical protein
VTHARDRIMRIGEANRFGVAWLTFEVELPSYSAIFVLSFSHDPDDF